MFNKGTSIYFTDPTESHILCLLSVILTITVYFVERSTDCGQIDVIVPAFDYKTVIRINVLGLLHHDVQRSSNIQFVSTMYNKNFLNTTLLRVRSVNADHTRAGVAVRR